MALQHYDRLNKKFVLETYDDPNKIAFSEAEVANYKDFLKDLEGVPSYQVLEPAFMEKNKIKATDVVVLLSGHNFNPFMVGYVGLPSDYRKFVLLMVKAERH